MEKTNSKPDPVFKIATQQVNKLLSGIRESSSRDELSDDQVHKLRVCTKKLRALLQLYRPCCSKKDLKYVEKTIKALADSYSGQRDAHVQYETLFREVKTLSQVHENDMQPLLNHYHRAKQNPENLGILKETKSGLEHILQAWEGKFKTCTATDLAPGVEYTYRRAQKLAFKAKQQNHDKAYHRCRKWVKYYMYQLKMLMQEKSSEDKAYIDKLTTLGELLGELHDRCVLEQSLISLLANSKAKNTNIEDTGLLVQSWLAEQKDLDKARCRKLFEDLFRYTHNPVKI